MSSPPARSELLRRQRATAERLRREVFLADASQRHAYFHDLRRQLRGRGESVDLDEVVAACAGADVIYVGDFHADPACQIFAAGLLDRLPQGPGGLALGVEFLYTRQQGLLDARQAGALSDAAFLRRVHYREEWGYPWEGFRHLLDRARTLGVPVHALDAPPRGGFDNLVRRDEHAARRITALLDTEPPPRLLVLFGESHVSRGHIPRRVRTRAARTGRALRDVTVIQDPDSLYWSLLATAAEVPPAVRLEADTFAVFHTSPLAKYEAYRQVLERWQGDVPAEEEVDLTPAVHHLIRALSAWLGLRPDRYRLHHRAGWAEDLVDSFPEVYTGPEAAELLVPIFEDHGRSGAEIAEGLDRLRTHQALYEPRSNSLFVVRYLPAQAAGEGARFLRAALSGRLFHTAQDLSDDPAMRTYGAAYNEALAFLGSRLIDPGGGYRWEPVSDDAARWLEAHREFERSGRPSTGAGLLEPLRESRPLRRAVARELGLRLGRGFFERVRTGAWGRTQLRSLFSRELTGRRARQVVLRHLRAAPPG